MSGPSLFQRIKRGLSVAAQAVITAPLKLPTKVIAAAKYVALLVGLLDALDDKPDGADAPDAAEERADE